jgi:hypothetical protein
MTHKTNRMQDGFETPKNTTSKPKKPKKAKNHFACWDKRLWMYETRFNDPHQSPFALD